MKMIYVENGRCLQSVLGDLEFQWKHKRILFVGTYKNAKIVDGKHQISSVFSIKVIKDYILSYLDIRYDIKLRKSSKEKKLYLQYMKKLKSDVVNNHVSLYFGKCRELLELMMYKPKNVSHSQ